jgi:hypothetical protein
MRILHHFGLHASERERAAFREAGVELPGGARSAGMVSVELTEDDPRWPAVAALCGQFRVFDAVSTQFTEDELDRAQWLGMVATGLHGYPEPSENGGFLHATFELTDYCRACGAGLRQAAPFRLRKAPSGKRAMLQLNWVLDEFFTSPEVWEAVFLPLGIGRRPVLLHRTSAAMTSLVQVEILAFRDLAMADRAPEVCSVCSRPKYRYSMRGPYPEPAEPDVPIFKSNQCFGSGAQAFRLVLVSNSLYRKIRDAGIRGVTFYPSADSLAAA